MNVVADPGAGVLYVARLYPGSIEVIDLGGWKIVDSMESFYFTRELAILPGQRWLLAGDYRTGRVAAVDLVSGETVKKLSFGKMLRNIDTDPATRRAAVVTYLGVFVFNVY